MSVKIMVVEDDELLNDSIVRILKSRQYDVFGVSNMKDGKRLFEKDRPDIVLLDIMLPDGKGYELLPLLTPHSKVIIMTALTDQESKYLCYELGAEDYLIKNFDMQELLYKIDVTKRNMIQEEIRIGDIVVDIKTRKMVCNNKSVDLPHSQIEVLRSLVQRFNQNTYLSKEDMVPLDMGDIDGSARVQNLIARLRKNLWDVNSEKVMIETIYGVGYRLVILS